MVGNRLVEGEHKFSCGKESFLFRRISINYEFLDTEFVYFFALEIDWDWIGGWESVNIGVKFKNVTYF